MKLLVCLLLLVAPSLASPCDPQPTGYGPVPTPDTAAAFLSDPNLQNIAATGQKYPIGYQKSFENLTAAINGPNYISYSSLRKYDGNWCASKCDITSGCAAWNLYEQRSPKYYPDANACPDPPSYTYYRCALWGSPISASQATNKGQTREKFQVVVAGSAGKSLSAHLLGYAIRRPFIPSLSHHSGYNRVSPGYNAGLIGPWRWVFAGGNEHDSKISLYDKGLLNITIAPSDPPAPSGAQVTAYFPDLDPFYPHYVLANAHKAPDVLSCSVGVNGDSQLGPGTSAISLNKQLDDGFRVTLTVDCPAGASGVVDFNNIRIYRYEAGYSKTDTLI